MLITTDASIIREMQIKTTVSCPLTLVRMAIIIKDKKWLGMIAHSYNPSTLVGQGSWITRD